MGYETQGSVRTQRMGLNDRQVKVDSQSEWENAELTNVEVSNGAVRLQQTLPAAINHRWDYEDEGSTGTLVDQEGSADGTLNGVSYTTDAFQGSHAGYYDGTAYTTIPNGLFDPTADWTVTTPIALETMGSDDRILDLRGDVDLILNVGRSGTDTLGVFYNGTDRAIRTLSTNTRYFVLIEHDSTNSELNVEVEGTTELTVAEAATTGGVSENRIFGNVNGGNEPTGTHDEMTTAPALLSDSEKQTLYDRVL